CEQGRPYACPYLADLQGAFCDQGSGWSCNEAGLLHITLARSGEDLRRTSLAGAADPLRRGCDLGFAAACRNLTITYLHWRRVDEHSANTRGLSHHPERQQRQDSRT